MDLCLTTLEKNRLWIKWKKVTKSGNGNIELKDVEFYGPVTQDYLPLEGKGTIKLDFTNHYVLRVDSYYIVDLTWDKSPIQEQGSIKFDKIKLHDENVGLMDKIKQSDTLLISCEGHTDEERSSGKYKMVYDAMLYKEGKEPYDFTKN